MSIKAERETDVLRAVLRYLSLRGVVCWRNNTGARKIGGQLVRWGDVGSADVLGLLPATRAGFAPAMTKGRMLCVEVKAGRNKPTPAQEAWLAMAAGAGALALVTRSVAELEGQLREAGY